MPFCGIRRRPELLRGDGIDQRIEQIGGRCGLTLPRININGDYFFPRIAAEGDAKVMFLILHPEIEVPGPTARLELGVGEAEPSDNIGDALLTLLSRCH
jgi:hypothetical protein